MTSENEGPAATVYRNISEIKLQQRQPTENMSVYVTSDPKFASEVTLVNDDASTGEQADTQPLSAQSDRQTLGSGATSIRTTGSFTTSRETTPLPSPSNLAPESSRQPRSSSFSLRASSRSPSRTGRGLKAVRLGKKGAVSAAVASVLETARIEHPECGTISDEMLNLLNEVLKGKGHEFANIPLETMHQVSVQVYSRTP